MSKLSPQMPTVELSNNDSETEMTYTDDDSSLVTSTISNSSKAKVPEIVSKKIATNTKEAIAKILKEGSFEQVCHLPHLHKKTLQECAKKKKYKSYYSIAFTVYNHIVKYMLDQMVIDDRVLSIIMPDVKDPSDKQIIFRVISIMWYMYSKYVTEPNNDEFFTHYLNIADHGWIKLFTSKKFSDVVSAKVEELSAKKLANEITKKNKEALELQKNIFKIKEDGRSVFETADVFKYVTKSMILNSGGISIERIVDDKTNKVIVNNNGKQSIFVMKDGKPVKVRN